MTIFNVVAKLIEWYTLFVNEVKCRRHLLTSCSTNWR